MAATPSRSFAQDASSKSAGSAGAVRNARMLILRAGCDMAPQHGRVEGAGPGGGVHKGEDGAQRWQPKASHRRTDAGRRR